MLCPMAPSFEQNIGLLTGHEQISFLATLNVESDFDHIKRLLALFREEVFAFRMRR